LIFFRLLNKIKKVSSFDAEVLLHIFKSIDFCSINEIELLNSLYGKRLDFIKAYIVFDCKYSLLSKRRKKLMFKVKNMRYTKRYVKKISHLVDECYFSAKEYKFFLW